MTKPKILGLLILICLFTSFGIAIRYNSTINNEQIEQLKQIKIQADEIAKSQLEQEARINLLEQAAISQLKIEAQGIGIASYYDYILPSGWSSKQHRVCASRDYPRGTMLRVMNISNQHTVDCLVTDYGPDASVFPERTIDLSSYVFSQIAPLGTGVINVSIKEIK